MVSLYGGAADAERHTQRRRRSHRTAPSINGHLPRKTRRVAVFCLELQNWIFSLSDPPVGGSASWQIDSVYMCVVCLGVLLTTRKITHVK